MLSKKSILFIGSESYDAATITIIEGLNKIGYTIYVYKKSNINSWFCNIIINDLNIVKDSIEFIISNLHWGTRWDLYKHFNMNTIKILIDGDDDNNNISWKNKYQLCIKNYNIADVNYLENNLLLNQRCMIDIKDYKPDIIFKSQKFSNEGIYLPFGINFTYLKFNKNIPLNKRNIDICHFSGPGRYRENMTNFINKNFKKYNVFNNKIYGEMIVDESIKEFCNKDNNIHSWHRWKTCDKYFETINNSKICIYVPAPGGWDSKRPWEILSQGSLLLYYKQAELIDKEYELNKISDYCQFNSYDELISKCEELLNNPNFLEKKRIECYNNAIKYFTSEPLAHYFISKIKNNS